MKPTHLSQLTHGVALFSMMLFVSTAVSSPFNSADSVTLSERIARADVVVLVKRLDSEFEVVDIVRQPEGGELARGSKIDSGRFRGPMVGDKFMLFGTMANNSTEWDSPLEVRQRNYVYIRNSPQLNLPAADRLEYFVKYLESSDPFIADDAFNEFAHAKYQDIAKVAPHLPREKLRSWLSSKDIPPGRLGLYGMMLGLCGNQDDAEMMEDRIFAKSEDFRLGIDGIMGGYLLLTLDKGLERIDEDKLKNKRAPFSETYAAMQAIRFMWESGDNQISQARLCESMRLLIDRPELADLAVAHLSRMRDWSNQDRLMELYDKEGTTPSTKRAIIRYMLTSMQQTGATDSTDRSSDGPPAHVAKGRKYIEHLEQTDPKTLNNAKRFFVLK